MSDTPERNIKYFSNGTLHMTGFKSVGEMRTHATEFLKCLHAHMREVLPAGSGSLVAENPVPPVVESVQVCMMNAYADIPESYGTVNLDALTRFIAYNPSIDVSVWNEFELSPGRIVVNYRGGLNHRKVIVFRRKVMYTGKLGSEEEILSLHRSFMQDILLPFSLEQQLSGR